MIPELKHLQSYTAKPYRESYRVIAKTLYKEASQQTVSKEARMLLRILEFDADASNGGIAQYFTNCNGQNVDELRAALKYFHFLEVLQILDGFLKTLPPSVDARNRNAVGVYLFSDKTRFAATKAYDRQFFAIHRKFVEELVRLALSPD